MSGMIFSHSSINFSKLEKQFFLNSKNHKKSTKRHQQHPTGGYPTRGGPGAANPREHNYMPLPGGCQLQYRLAHIYIYIYIHFKRDAIGAFGFSTGR